MILPDVNVLLYAYDAGSSRHARAREWWEGALTGSEPVRLPWVTILGFIRIGTHPRVFSRPMAIEEAVAHVSRWLERPMVEPIEPGPRHWAVLAELLRDAQISGNLTTDAHLAALAIEYGGTVYTTDQDFARFRRAQTSNPVAP